MENNKILIDWLSFTSSISTPEQIIDLLGMGNCPFSATNGAKGWKQRLYFNCISIHFDGHDGLIWVEMSGQGCRAFETLGHGDYNILFDFILNNNEVNITRLDVAYDDFNGLLDMDKLVNDTLNQNFVSRARKWSVELSSDGSCITHGKRKSDILIRIYDKAAERGRSDEVPHWIRCEIMMKHDRANEFIRLLTPQVEYSYDFSGKICKTKAKIINEGESIDKLYFLVLNNYLRYIKPNDSDSNKWRSETAEHWVEFCTSVTSESISLFVKPGMEYNALKLSNVVTHMYAGAIHTYIKLFGVNDLVERVEKQSYKLNIKYRMLLAEDTALRQKVGANCDT